MNEGLKLTIGLLLIANRAPALSWRDSQSDNPRSTVAEGIGVAVDRRCAAKMSVENLRSFGEIALLHEVDHSLHGFAFIDRVGNHAFEARAQANGLLRLLRRNAIDGISIVLDQDDIVFDDLLAEFDELCGITRDLKHLRLGLDRGEGGVDPDHLALAAVLGKADQHTGMGRAGNRADDDVVEGKAKLLLLGTNRLGEADITKAAIFVDRGSRRDRVRLAALGLHVRDRLFPTLPDTDVKPFVDHLDIGAHDPAQQDVADAVIDGVLVRHPAFLNQPAFHSDFRRDSSDHARVVRLHPPIETSVSALEAIASGMMYSSLRSL